MLKLLIVCILLCGCATTSIKDITTEKYENGTIIEKTVIKKAIHRSIFSDKKFDSLSAKVGETKVSAKTYTSTVNSEAIEKTGAAVGTIVGEAVHTAAIGA